MLERAIRLAAEAHQGQIDKAGAPYILHPLRLMLRMETPVEMMAAVLHDVVEDTPWTLETLRDEGFSEEVVDAVAHLTRRKDESYNAFIERAAGHPVARRVKLADLEDNMDLRRLDGLTKKDQARLLRYQKAWRFLKDA
ncbi:MAG: HD domain-containing protein [Rhodothermales bacterium]